MSGEILQGFTNSNPNSGANLQALSSVTNAIAKLTQGYGAAQNEKAKANASDFNASIARENASSVGLANATNVENLALAGKAAVGKQAAAFGQAGIGGPAEGTAALAIRQSQINAEMGLLTQQYAGNVKQTSLTNQAVLDQYYGNVSRANSRRVMTEGGISATAALINGYGRYTNSKVADSANDAAFRTVMSEDYSSTTPSQYLE